MNDAVTPEHLRQACGRFATGVTAICARDARGTYGMTVNSFTSVSLDPPLVLFCSQPEARVLGALERSGAFTVNVLSSTQEATSNRLAKRGGAEKMEGVGVVDGAVDAPRLAGALAVLDCVLERTEPGGDHVIVLGRVAATYTAGETEDPLLFYRGAYRALRPRA